MSALRFWHHHGGLSVPDLDAAIAWYGEKLGFQVEKRFPIPTIPAEVAIVANGDLRMEIFQVPEAAALPEGRREPNTDVKTHGNKHVAFAIADVDSFAEELRARDVDIVWVHKFPFGANIFIRDCAGNLIEFLEAEPLTGAPSSL
jgi:methylmalonyl-CoA/ethylmalonyl-CoA epimerase